MPEVTDPVQIEAILTEALVELAPDVDEIDRSMTLEEIDVDSLDLAEFAQIVEDKLGVILKGSDFGDGVGTVGDVIDLVIARVQAAA
jgi:acyl carrier protein